MRRIVIVGGGTGGTAVANRLRRRLPAQETQIDVVDGEDRHLYQPGLLFVPFGLADPARLSRPRRAQLSADVGYVAADVERVDAEAHAVLLTNGDRLEYDVLVIASGARLLPEETDGLLGPEWGRSVFSFYTLPAAVELRAALRRFTGGRLVVNVVDLPIKCPVAPLEFAFLADAYFRRRGIRDSVDLRYATPLDAAFTKPVAAHELGELLTRRNITVETEFATGAVDGAARQLVSYDGRRIDFDLAVVVPLHGGAPFVARTDGLADELGFVMTDPSTLRSKLSPEIFALGDATDLPSSKAGSVAHFQSATVVENVCRTLDGLPLDEGFDGHANCFVETGAGKALLVDFNYEIEPVPGHYPGRVGLPLLRESRLNHLGKRAFAWIYWHVLLRGRSMPGISDRMPVSGKRLDVLAKDTGTDRIGVGHGSR